MTAASDLVDRLRADLDGTLRAYASDLAGVGPAAADLAEALITAGRGGKLLRPAFCWWGWRAGGGATDDPRIGRAAAALELLHAAALVQDDVLDASDLRRGLPTVRRTFAELHAGRGWTGSAETFGDAAAVLAGDLLLVWAEQALRRSGFDRDTLDRAWPVFDTMRLEVLVGQYLDVALQASAECSVDASLQVIRMKSARYTVRRPLEIGAELAGGTPDVLGALAAYAEPLGEAFQLRDDLLGVFGDPARTGKPAGDDVREGKRTVLLALAEQAADPGQRAVLDRWVGSADLDADGLAAVRTVLVDTGSVAECERLVGERAAAARAALTEIAEPAATGLRELADAAVRRSS